MQDNDLGRLRLVAAEIREVEARLSRLRDARQGLIGAAYADGSNDLCSISMAAGVTGSMVSRLARSAGVSSRQSRRPRQ